MVFRSVSDPILKQLSSPRPLLHFHCVWLSTRCSLSETLCILMTSWEGCWHAIGVTLSPPSMPNNFYCHLKESQSFRKNFVTLSRCKWLCFSSVLEFLQVLGIVCCSLRSFVQLHLVRQVLSRSFLRWLSGMGEDCGSAFAQKSQITTGNTWLNKRWPLLDFVLMRTTFVWSAYETVFLYSFGLFPITKRKKFYDWGKYFFTTL